MSTVKEVGPFSGDQKPVRDGVYKRLLPISQEKHWALFSKGQWYCWRNSHAAAQSEKRPSNYQDLPWWGCDHGA